MFSHVEPNYFKSRQRFTVSSIQISISLNNHSLRCLPPSTQPRTIQLLLSQLLSNGFIGHLMPGSLDGITCNAWNPDLGLLTSRAFLRETQIQMLVLSRLISSLFALSAVPSSDEEARQGNTIFMIGTLTGHARLRASTS